MAQSHGPVSFEGNPSVSKRILEEAAQVTKKLEECGLNPRPQYNLEPPFGGKLVSNPPLRSQQRQPSAPDVAEPDSPQNTLGLTQ